MRKINILLIEDDPGDIKLITECFEEFKGRFNLSVIDDGINALAYLKKQGEYVGSPRPDFIILDMNMPRKDGHELLEEFKSDPNLKLIPIVVFTTSSSDADILKAYQSGANCFITKPVEFDELRRVIREIVNCWGKTVSLPK